MSDYVPRFKPGQAFTSQASAAITGGQLCAVTGSGTVGPTAGATTAWVGTAAFDVASGENVTLHCGGVQKLVAAGAITAGDQVVSAAAGKVATLAAATTAVVADINAARQVVGVALTTAVDGATVDIAMVR